MRVPFVDLARQYRSLQTQLQEALQRVGESGYYILGPEVGGFETEFSQYCETRFAVGVGNGSDALLLPLLCMELGPEDEVVTAPNSFAASAWVIAKAGARLVFCDVDEETMNLDPELLESSVGPNTRALLPVHLTGRLAAMEKINELAAARGLKVIEDAAQAVGARRHGTRAGAFGWCAGFSLHPLKNLHGYGDGGVITSNDEELVASLKKYRNHGLHQGTCEFWGINSRLDELQAAFMRVKLPLLESWNRRYRDLALRYLDGLEDKVRVPRFESYEEPVFHRFMIRHPQRDRLAEFLQERGVGTRVNYPVPLHLHPAARPHGYARGDFPVTERLADTILSLPLYPEMTEAEVDYVIEQIREFSD